MLSLVVPLYTVYSIQCTVIILFLFLLPGLAVIMTQDFPARSVYFFVKRGSVYFNGSVAGPDPDVFYHVDPDLRSRP